MTPTEEKLIDVLKKGLRLRADPSQPIGAQTPIFGKNGLGLDSVDVLEIAVLVDKNFGVQLHDRQGEAREALASIGSLAAYIDKNRRPV
ncbi:MAG TPA: phosphopantetheine-binding protein [Phycisphaerae bacterium]|nr:phosphopantetheine-binding protein [Phycisphaerae bacterium]